MTCLAAVAGGDAPFGAQAAPGGGHSVLSLSCGDHVRIARQGAQVVSWTTADGVERLYLSPRSRFGTTHPIRGGVPLCFPQFNLRALGDQALPKHGLVRTLPWRVGRLESQADAAVASFYLESDAQTLALWPCAFAAEFTVHLRPGRLRMEFCVRNTSRDSWPFALALHTYLRVPDVTQVRLRGLAGLRYWDGVQHLKQPDTRLLQHPGDLALEGETDRVYEAVTMPLELRYSGTVLQLSQSASLPEVVVWNPAAARCAEMDDLPPDGWRHMLCVEAARINQPVLLVAGASWTGWQELHTRAVD
jgi:glucose-6-phosphate 1-epimerase